MTHINAQAATAAMSVRLAHRPLFLAAVVCAVAAMLRPYPTLADMALYTVRCPEASELPADPAQLV